MPSAISSSASFHTPLDDPRGIVAALAAFLVWGLLPLYWKQLGAMPAIEQLCHRIVWAVVVLGVAVVLTGRHGEIIQIFRTPKLVGCLLCSTLVISLNWFLYIWAVSHGRVLDSSLGYYINPLMNTLLGYLLLRERFTRIQGIGILLAGLGVGWSVVGHGSLPLLALALAVTFGLYGMIRKVTPVDPMSGLFVETLLMFPFACSGLIAMYGLSDTSQLPSRELLMWAFWAGPATLVPMLLFNYAARHIRLMLLGLTQYVSPTVSFLLSLFVFHETFNHAAGITFVLIWTGLIIFTWDEWREARRQTMRAK